MILNHATLLRATTAEINHPSGQGGPSSQREDHIIPGATITIKISLLAHGVHGLLVRNRSDLFCQDLAQLALVRLDQVGNTNE